MNRLGMSSTVIFNGDITSEGVTVKDADKGEAFTLMTLNTKYNKPYTHYTCNSRRNQSF